MSSIWCGYYIRTEGDDFMREKIYRAIEVAGDNAEK